MFEIVGWILRAPIAIAGFIGWTILAIPLGVLVFGYWFYGVIFLPLGFIIAAFYNDKKIWDDSVKHAAGGPFVEFFKMMEEGYQGIARWWHAGPKS